MMLDRRFTAGRFTAFPHSHYLSRYTVAYTRRDILITHPGICVDGDSRCQVLMPVIAGLGYSGWEKRLLS